MGFKENLLLYAFIGVIVYLFGFLDFNGALILLQFIGVSVFIGKTIEIISYNVSVKYKLSARGILFINFVVLSIVITILYKLKLIEDIKFTVGISVIITLIMDFHHHRKYTLYNKKLEVIKQQLAENIKKQ